MYYTCLSVTCRPELSDMLMAMVSLAGFEGFLETDHGFEAFTENDRYDEAQLRSWLSTYERSPDFGWEVTRVESRNWNEEWEKNFEPVVVEGRCYIRAAFHAPQSAYPLELVITPSMAFGTGHHATTYLMVKAQLGIDHEHKRVMDAGCGTGILAILASKLGAGSVEAFDVDPVSVSNTLANINQNHCANIRVQQGIIRDLSFDHGFDLVLANITKNVLKEDLPQYKAYLKTGGQLVISGFYEEDIGEMVHEAGRYGMKSEGFEVRNRWAVMILKKD